MFLAYVKGKKYKECPHCSFWVERIAGCDHMHCRCRRDFCYKCGGVYGNCECSRVAREAMVRMIEQRRLQRVAAQKKVAKAKKVAAAKKRLETENDRKRDLKNTAKQRELRAKKRFAVK